MAVRQDAKAQLLRRRRQHRLRPNQVHSDRDLPASRRTGRRIRAPKGDRSSQSEKRRLNNTMCRCRKDSGIGGYDRGGVEQLQRGEPTLGIKFSGKKGERQ